jgi:hypothetical protein
MLIQVFTGALGAQLLELTFGPGAAEPGAIGGGFLFRPLFRNALSELFQIDQIPHAGPRHADLVVIATMSPIDECVRVPFNLTRSKFSGCALSSSILIYEFPIMPSDRKMSCVVFSKYFLLYHGEVPP